MPRSRRLATPRFDDKRPPLERLASVAREPGKERAQRMMRRIRAELEETPEPGPWIAAARALAAQSVITENAALFLTEIFLECITFNAVHSDPEIVRLYAELDRVKREHGLSEDEDWLVHEGPPEWQELNAAWNRRDDEIRAAALRALGYGEIADLMERDPEGFEERSHAGYQDFWGSRLVEEFEIRPELN